jgi:S-DNA-T family DNA segregation ATPase FtsK/SpoIIIE
MGKHKFPPLFLLDEALKPHFTILSETSFSLPIVWSTGLNGMQHRDLADLKSVLIAGVPGSGKSNLLHQFMLALLYNKHPSQIKFVLLDFKGLDLSAYMPIEKQFLAKIPGCDSAVVTDTTIAVHTLNALCIEMDNRYDLLKEASVKDAVAYNDKFIRRKITPHKGHQFLPSIILVVDNVEAFITLKAKLFTMPLQRLVTMGYKAGIFIILTTSGLYYKSLPNELLHVISERIALRLNSKEEYRKLYETSSVPISYELGAFHYLYQGRVLSGKSENIPADSVKAVVDFISTQPSFPSVYLLPEFVDEKDLTGKEFDRTEMDPLFTDSARLIVQNQIGSTSLLQRRKKLSYNRAGRIMNQLEAAGIVGPPHLSKTREVLIKTEKELDNHFDALGIS